MTYPYAAPTAGVPYTYGAGLPPQAGPSVSRTLSGWLQGLFWATAATSAFAALASVNTVAALETYLDAPIGSDYDELEALIDAEDTAVALGLLGLMVWVAALIVLMVWMNKAHKATARLDPGDRRWTSGWTVGGWFIPFGAAVIPKMVLNEIERIATAPRTDGRVTPSWRTHTTWAGGWAWWLLLVAGNVLLFASGSVTGGTDLDPSELRAGYWLDALGEAAFVASAVFGVFLVRRISSALSPEQLPPVVPTYNAPPVPPAPPLPGYGT
jgi:hypothetical protein